MAEDTSKIPIKIGGTVYNADGEPLGTVRGYDEDGFYVTTTDGIDALSVQHEHAGPTYGEAELVWRCSNCGAVGDLDELPEECPNCGASIENLYYWTED